MNDADNGKHEEFGNVLKDFYNFLIVEMRLEEATAKNHCWNLERFLKAVGKKPSEILRVDVRNYLLEQMQNKAQATVNNYLKTLKRFFRDYQGNSKLVESFKFKQSEFKQKRVPSKAELKRFYEALPNIENQAVFLMYASSGWRAKEVVSLLRKNIDLQQRRLYAVKNSSRTKHVGYGFFNEETAEILKELLKDKHCQEDEHVFLSYRTLRKIWVEVSKKSGVKITPQVLREWFCSEMGRLRVPDRYIDAFCGRVPNSILARHYTDYNSEALKEIYDKADLKVLS